MARKGKKRAGRCTRKNRQTTSDAPEPKELQRAPHSFVIHRGYVGSSVRELVRDFRRVMEPFTASSLRVTQKNTLKDFVSIAGMLHVTHFCIFTRTDLGAYLKIVRVPHGPTLSFRVHNYTLAKDVVSNLKKQQVFIRQFEHHPLVVLNGFSGEGMHLKLMSSTFQNMFPTINLLKVVLSNIRRCVLLNYDPVTKLIDFRHFAIKVVPAGVSKSVKKIVQSKVPNLARYKDISEYLTNPTQLSESEAEDDPTNHVVLPQNLSSRGNMASNVSAIRVVEIGPRLTLQLLKVESAFLSGDVLYHSYVEKSEEEIKLIKNNLEQKRALKEKRRREQVENTKKKELRRKMQKEQSVKGMKLKYGQSAADNSSRQDQNADDGNDVDDEDDSVWYKEEVGQDPEPDLFTTNNSGSIKRKKSISVSSPAHQKRRKKIKSGILKVAQKSKQFGEKRKHVKFSTNKKGFVSKEHKRAQHGNK